MWRGINLNKPSRFSVEEAQVVCVIPLYNGGKVWSIAAKALDRLRFDIGLLVIDSGSQDGSLSYVPKDWGLIQINACDFDHGGTRNLALDHCPKAQYIVYLTQDAILSDPDSIDKLLKVFDDATIGLAYGRQMPHDEASDLAIQARQFNYPEISYCWGKEAIYPKGIRAVFNSNSFAAYRRVLLDSFGGFPQKIIVGEDVVLAWQALQSGWRIAYVAQASVKHSHNYGLQQEWQRYFDVGVMHAEQILMMQACGRAESEAWRFIAHQVRFLLINRSWFLLTLPLYWGVKYLAYRLGLNYRCLPRKLCAKFSGQKAYWFEVR